jgi:methylmalonyl-CoA/ethylmalonyl-CoA epimerase
MVNPAFKIDHVTAIVNDANEAAKTLSRLLGIAPCASLDLTSMVIRSFRIGSAEIHLNSPRGPGIVQDHHAGHGPSFHHLALRVEDLDATLEELLTVGFRSKGEPIETMRGVREVFLDPATTSGLWIQLVQRRSNSANEFDACAVEALASTTTSTRNDT